jgi:hypothetical protein
VKVGGFHDAVGLACCSQYGERMHNDGALALAEPARKARRNAVVEIRPGFLNSRKHSSLAERWDEEPVILRHAELALAAAK